MKYQAFKQRNGKWCARQYCSRLASHTKAFYHGAPDENGDMQFWNKYLPIIGKMIEADTPDQLHDLLVKARRGYVIWV